MLESSQDWLADGTLKTAPELFSQLYVIHALQGGPDPLQNGNVLPSLFIQTKRRLPTQGCGNNSKFSVLTLSPAR